MVHIAPILTRSRKPTTRQQPRAGRWPARAAQLGSRWRAVAAHLPRWLCQWQFWLVLVPSALLRLAAVGRSPFGSDDALLLLEVARATHDRLLPATGIFNSLLALNFPAYTYVLLPFASNPQGMALLTDLLNVAAVACLYVFVERMFGKWPALLAGLLFATATYDTWMSTFIWQQTVIIPITLVALWLAFEGAVRQRRHWFAPHVILLALAIQIYPQSASLLPVTVCAVLFGWRSIRWIDVLIAENVCVLIWLPVALFELASGGYDLPIYAAWLRAPKMLDPQALGALIQALGPQSGDYLGASTWYARLAPSLEWLAPLLMVLWALATVWLVARLLAPLARALRPLDRSALWRATRSADWRGRLLLLLWPVTMLALTLRHATPIYIHYVFFITPVIYVTIALFLIEAPAWLARHIRAWWAPRAAAGLTWATGGAIVLAQVSATAVFVLVLATGQAQAASWAVVPIGGYTQALAATIRLAGRLHAQQVFIAGDANDPYMAQYWAARQTNLAPTSRLAWTSYSSDSCAILPEPAQPALLLALTTPGPALAGALQTPGTRLVQTYAVARGARFELYQLTPSAPTRAPLATIPGAFQLQTFAIATLPGETGRWLISRWTALASTPPGPSVAEYQFAWSFTAPGAGGATTQQRAMCAPSGWRAGEGVVIAVPVPTGMTSTATWQTSVVVTRDTHTWYQPHLGPLVLDTAKELTLDYVELPPGPLRLPG